MRVARPDPENALPKVQKPLPMKPSNATDINDLRRSINGQKNTKTKVTGADRLNKYLKAQKDANSNSNLKMPDLDTKMQQPDSGRKQHNREEMKPNKQYDRSPQHEATYSSRYQDGRGEEPHEDTDDQQHNIIFQPKLPNQTHFPKPKLSPELLRKSSEQQSPKNSVSSLKSTNSPRFGLPLKDKKAIDQARAMAMMASYQTVSVSSRLDTNRRQPLTLHSDRR